MNSQDLLQKVSLETLKNLLKIHGEGNNLDFKQTFSLNSQKERAELVRDVLAFANTEGGGHIVFGVVDKTFEPIGLPANVHIDTTTIYNAISKYIVANIQLMAAEYEIECPTESEKNTLACYTLLSILALYYQGAMWHIQKIKKTRRRLSPWFDKMSSW